MILFPLAIDDEGGLLSSNDPTDLAASEVFAILDTILYTRVMRMDYGSRTYVLDSLDLGSLLNEVSLKLKQSLEVIGLKNAALRSESSLEDFRAGLVKLVVQFQAGTTTEEIYYDTSVSRLRSVSNQK